MKSNSRVSLLEDGLKISKWSEVPGYELELHGDLQNLKFDWKIFSPGLIMTWGKITLCYRTLGWEYLTHDDQIVWLHDLHVTVCWAAIKSEYTTIQWRNFPLFCSPVITDMGEFRTIHMNHERMVVDAQDKQISLWDNLLAVCMKVWNGIYIEYHNGQTEFIPWSKISRMWDIKRSWIELKEEELVLEVVEKDVYMKFIHLIWCFDVKSALESTWGRPRRPGTVAGAKVQFTEKVFNCLEHLAATQGVAVAQIATSMLERLFDQAWETLSYDEQRQMRAHFKTHTASESETDL